MNLTTASYRTYRPEWGLAIRTSVGPARWFRHAHVHARTLTPYGIFSVIDDRDDYTAAYVARLDRHGRAVLDELDRLTGGAGGVLLCHCNLSRPGAWCHRNLASGWLVERFGLDVPEHDDGPPRLDL